MAIDISLRSYLLAQASITTFTTTVQVNHISQGASSTRIWLSRRASDEEVDLGGNGGLIESYFDIEAMSEDIDTAQDLAQAIKEALNGYRGVMGAQPVQAVFVADHTDDYLPRNQDDDLGLHIASLDVQIWHAQA